MPPILVTPGDPLGVGAEVTLDALHDADEDLVIVGDLPSLRREMARRGLDLPMVHHLDQGRGPRILSFEPGALPVELAALEIATAACLEGRASALVTGPIHKKRLADRGFQHPGHTTWLAERCGVQDPVMAFVGERMRVALATIHLPLRDVPAALDLQMLLHTLRVTERALREDLGLERPRIAVAGLNPHAGEQGLLGDEELRVIGPACDQARTEGLQVEGPMSAETAARLAATGRVDLMLAMYHDQGLVPLKLLDFGSATNWTLGLPIVRTSVDHGTADDIAGQGLADPGSMRAALNLARHIVRRRNSAAR